MHTITGDAHHYRLAQAAKLIRLFEAGQLDQLDDGVVTPDTCDYLIKRTVRVVRS